MSDMTEQMNNLLLVSPIVVTGSPSGGFTFYGPFSSKDAATEWAEEQRFTESWWVDYLEPCDSI